MYIISLFIRQIMSVIFTAVGGICLCRSVVAKQFILYYNAHKENMFMCFKNTFLGRYLSYIQYTIKQNLQFNKKSVGEAILSFFYLNHWI